MLVDDPAPQPSAVAMAGRPLRKAFRQNICSMVGEDTLLQVEPPQSHALLGHIVALHDRASSKYASMRMTWM